MDDTLIDNINSTVKSDDILYHLGDFCAWFGNNVEYHNRLVDYRNRIKCKNIRYIYGNHDKKLKQNKELQCLFQSCSDYEEMNYKGIDFILFHYPIFEWNKKSHGSIHVFGHQHYSRPNDPVNKWIDGGVDNPLCNFAPFHIDTIIDVMSQKA